MKLYTEEQVRQIFKEAQHLQDCNEPLYHMFEDLLVDNNITPIELPSDEEIKSYSNRYSTMHEDVSDKLGKYLVSAIHIDGAKWMKEQILNQNK